MSKITYSVADGYVLRGEEPIAQYEDGQLTFLEGKDKYRAPVVRYLRENNLAADVAPTRPGEELPTDPGSPRLPELVEAVVDEVVAVPAAVVAPVVVKALPAAVKVYADAPVMTPEEGEKTPAFARWLIANHPEDARSRSALRNFFQ
jgi:hypothetical protein